MKSLIAFVVGTIALVIAGIYCIVEMFLNV
jgi:hypothetical protein